MSALGSTPRERDKRMPLLAGNAAARVGWSALTLLAILLFVLALPHYHTRLQTPCEGSGCASRQLTATGLEALRQEGVSAEAYATMTVALALLFTGICFGLATIVVWKGAGDRTTPLAGIMLVLLGVVYPEVPRTFGDLRPGLSWLAEAIGILGFVSVVLFVNLFPKGTFQPRWARWAVLIWSLAVAHGVIAEPEPGTPWSAINTVMFAVGAATSLLALGYRYRRIVTPTERQQIHWVVLGITFALAGTLATVVADLVAGTAALTIVALDIVRTMAVLAIPVSITIAILRHRLWGVDVVINRALVYASLTAGIFSLYVLIVGTLGWALRSEDNLFVSIVATAAVALLFAPLRDRLERAVNHLMYGHRDDPFTVVTRLGERLDATLAPDAMLPAVVSSVREALQLPYVEIVGTAGVEGSAIASGEPVNGIDRIPLSYRHEEVGVLLVGRRRGESSFSAADRALLADLARQAGIAMHMVNITAELQRSRERLVTAREEERRRLRRDLHDGLGAQMAALKVQSRVLRELIRRDPDAAEVEATALHAELQEAIVDVRRLVHDLRPPALDDLGLVGALGRLAQQHDGSGPTVVVIAPEESVLLPAAVEVALYRVAQEALVNVVRHADADRCEVRLKIDDRNARLCITDDGRGIPEETLTGVGLISMRERATELGGTCRIDRGANGGTRIDAWLPIGGAG